MAHLWKGIRLNILDQNRKLQWFPMKHQSNFVVIVFCCLYDSYWWNRMAYILALGCFAGTGETMIGSVSVNDWLRVSKDIQNGKDG